nr:reverse transcriptase domain-containing protein [Tanacetum cinerariifolium]
MMTSDQFFGLEKDNPHDHIRWFNKITSTIKYKDVPNSAIKLMLFSFSLAATARQWLEKEPSHSILTWEDLVSKFINDFFLPSRTTNLRNEILNFQQRFDESFHEAWDRYKDLIRACAHNGFTELHQLDTFYNALNPADQDSLNSAVGGNMLERRTQDVLTIIENKSKIVKLTHAVNQQTSVVTTAMTAILKQFQATPPPAFIKVVEEICVTCGGAHPYYQCLVAGGKFFSKLQDNIQGYVLAAAINYNQEDKRVEETLTDQDLAEYTIKVPPPLVPKPKPPSQRNFVVHQRDPLHPNIPYPLRMHKQKQQEKMKSKSINFGKSLLSNKEKLLELENTPLNENCSAVILNKLPKKLRVPGKFLILYGFSKLKCKALGDLEVKDDIFDPEEGNVLIEKLLDLDSTKDPREKLFNINLLIAKIKSLNDNPTPVHMLKPLSPYPILVEDSDSFLEKFDKLSLIRIIFCPNLRLLAIIRKRRILAVPLLMLITLFPKPRVHVPNLLTTHPTLMLDSDFIPSDNSILEFKIFYFDIEEKNSGTTTIHADISLLDLECFNFNGKPDPGELTSIVDFGTRKNILSATNVNLPPRERSFSSLHLCCMDLSLFSYVSCGSSKSSLHRDVSHRCETFMKFNVYPKLLNESLMEILSSTCSPMGK